MTTPAAWEFKPSPEQAMKIAIVSLNWSAVDHTLGTMIAAHSGIHPVAHIAELIHVVDLKKKIDIINVRQKRGEFPAVAAPLVKEMVFIGENYRNDRNMLAHGMLFDDGEGGILFSASKTKWLSMRELDGIVDESNYAGHVAQALSAAVIFGVTKPLPPRPPVRPR
jgi:hypothetical protein